VQDDPPEELPNASKPEDEPPKLELPKLDEELPKPEEELPKPEETDDDPPKEPPKELLLPPKSLKPPPPNPPYPLISAFLLPIFSARFLIIFKNLLGGMMGVP